MGRTGPTDCNAVRAVSVFANLAYLPSAAALINSLLHFRVRARIKLYDFAGLPHLARTYLAQYVDIIAPSPQILGDRYRQFWNYRPRMLAESVDPYELQMDADTIVLSDLEEAFSEIERGNFTAVREWEYDPNRIDEKGRDRRTREPDARAVFFTGSCDIRKSTVRDCRSTMLACLGLSRERHLPLLDSLGAIDT